jgi:outer membrane protein assembly factor BamB
LNKQSLVGFTIILLIAMSTLSAALMHTAKAYDVPTYSYVVASPNPVGVGQSTLVTAFLDKYPPTDFNFVTYQFWDFTVTITDPSGNTETKSLVSDYIGAATFNLIPDEIGDWTLKMHFEGADIPENSRNYVPSDSNIFTLTVQEDQIVPWPNAPLPTEYWQRPIEGQNRAWESIAGNWLAINQISEDATWWLGDARGNPYTTAPSSAHIMWTKPLLPGGVVGLPYIEGFYTGDSYERKERGKIIMNGVLYRNIPVTNNPSGNGFMAIDVRTGKELFRTETGSIDFGQLLVFDSLNQHGVIPYLWSNSLKMYDATTGNLLLEFENITGGDKVLDSNGNLLTYTMNYPQHTLTLWNATKAVLLQQNPGPFSNENFWRPVYGKMHDWAPGVEWNVTIPDLAAYGVTGAGFNAFPMGGIRAMCYEADALVYRYRVEWANETYPTGYVVDAAYSMTDGHQLWVKFRDDPNSIEPAEMSWWGGYIAGPEQYFVFKQETRTWQCYSAITGELLWRTDPYENPWGMFYQTLGDTPGYCMYDKLYTIAFDGRLHCYDLDNGNLLWDYFIGNSGTETPYGTWPLSYIAVADHKVFISNGEHSPNQPLYRGYELYCIDADTGDLIWKTDGYHQGPIVADGYVVTLNGYDMQHYCFGKGPTATVVEAPMDAITLGSSLVIRGMVTDVSPGTMDYTQTARFPNGVPAMSDEDMSAWMEYVYMQKPLPTDAVGVEVWIDVLDANGNYRNIGTTTSDLSGFYKFTWEPDIPGDYTVVATFAGSDSYYASYAETAFTVVEPEVTPAPTPTPAPMTDMYILGSTAGIIIAIIVIGLVLILMVRKR